MTYLNNFKGAIKEKISPKVEIAYQKDIVKNNYDIILKRSELNDLMLALNTIINDINNNQNRIYIINKIKNIITKLKSHDTPPKKDFTTVPTFKTVNLKDVDNDFEKKSSYTPLTPGPSDSFFDDNKTFCTDKEPVSGKEKYEGPLVNGKKEGKGVYIYKTGCKYEGYFKDDKKEGSGIFYYKNGDRYKGDFHDGNYHGNGIFYFNNGDRYEGEFNKNKYSGKGKYFYHNGDRFEGLWLNDKKNGQGVYIYLNGDKIIGNYKNGKPIGSHTKYSKNGGVLLINYSQ